MKRDSGTIKLLSRQDTIDLGATDIELAIEAVRQSFQALDSGTCLQPPKTSLRFSDSNLESQAGVVNVLPSAIEINSKRYFGVKSLGAMPANTVAGLPRATGLLTLFNDEFKTPIAGMDCQVISAMRTGAVSAIAAQVLCDPEIESIGCVGAGVNMYTQLIGVLHTLKNIKTVKIYSRGQSKNNLAKKLTAKFNDIVFLPVQSSTEAVKAADLIITCVANTNQPVVKAQDVNRPGVTVFNIGCLENEPKLLQSMDMIISDNWQQTKHRGVQTHAVAYSQDLIDDSDVVNLGDIIAGKLPGRDDRRQKIFFGPTGMGIEDLALGIKIYENSLKSDVGVNFELWDDMEWI